MIGLGTIINTAAVAAAGVAGHFLGGVFREDRQKAVCQACGVSVLFISVAGAMEGMLKIASGSLTSGRSMLIVLSVVLGTIAGELLNIEGGVERFGEWLKKKTGNAKDPQFVEAFVTASLTTCVGAMTIVGALQDGLLGDYSMLAVKAVLDFAVVAVMCSGMSKGAAFSAIPIFVIQGTVTLFAKLIAPIMTDAAVGNLSLIGSVLIFCVGINLIWGKKIKVANMLPALLIAVLLAYLPFGL